MEYIKGISKTLQNVIFYPEYSDNINYIKSPYLKTLKYDNGVLVYNALTYELIFLYNYEIYKNNKELRKYLVKHWFLIAENIDPMTLSEVFMQAARSKIAKKIDNKTSYVVTTTTSCNARCYYCYEAGMCQKTMDEQTAIDVSKFLIQNAGEGLHITWFGGEPLCNLNVINIITNKLRDVGINFSSSMISNGYLIDSVDMNILKNQWNLSRIQITLDGTKDIYQHSKNYKNEDVNAYEKVLDNIELLLKNDIFVSVRLNVSIHNCNDLLDLIDYLSMRFKQYKNFVVYSNELFIGLGDPPMILSKEETELLLSNVQKITQKIEDSGFYAVKDDLFSFRPKHCMADSGRCSIITPVGDLTPCEHHFDDEICGNIYDGITHPEILEDWKKTGKIYEECNSCYYYPKCVRIANCPTSAICTNAHRKLLDFRVELQMKKTYENYLNKL